MILTFSKSKFVRRIKLLIKIHTIREDKIDRWHKGRVIHFWSGNPRNIKNHPYQFKNGMCVSTQKIEIEYQGLEQNGSVIPVVKIDGKYLDYHTKVQLAIYDGFDSVKDFFEWFNKDFKGKLIHWTDYKY